MKHLKPEEIIKRLTNPERLGIEPRERVWNFLKRFSPAIILDMGAGTGYYTHIFIRDGVRVIACDIIKELLLWLMEHAPPNDRSRILPVLIREKIPIKQNSVDMVFMANLHHELSDNRTCFLEKVKKTLKPKGIIVIIDWKDVPSPIGPPMTERLNKDVIEKDLESAGLKSIFYHDWLPYHHFFTATV